ncbi:MULTISPECIES: ABC transporter ATP-binding protein [Psychrobacillus]|jgi:acetoin utilization transport system ATP-binding protein|uniref:ABC transporter ATP-binding protein n=1 Tax=Psychrobacillus faecigallinarum TaxID=2762235 RepID=A0ABR8RE84_9BACI|nr:ABC transporter ATP-binding protein [Psychrobacillus faecigallinarum]MBD7946071.1 ABC transporter ATP-binding protein [Psychrobacillus faecigallinarum]QGM32301.1 ATP-binding cassette domain-containing protein [Bacillus sp. N3536]
MIHVNNVNHTFLIGKKGKEKKVPVLKGLTFNVQEGEIVAVVGKSGSGKSTLLNTIAGFMSPEQGSIIINGQETAALNETERAEFRLNNFGFIFQSFQLMPGLTAFENIELPLKLKGVSPKKRKVSVLQLMKKVGLESVSDHYPNELSGGQQQRVSIARALITNPPILLADEPTGSLDSETEQDILMLIQDLNQTMGVTFVIITHDDEVASIAHRKFKMHDGELKKEDMSHVI